VELQLFFVVFWIKFLVEFFPWTQVPRVCGMGFYLGSFVGFLFCLLGGLFCVWFSIAWTYILIYLHLTAKIALPA